jgi:hypothetical protein
MDKNDEEHIDDFTYNTLYGFRFITFVEVNVLDMKTLDEDTENPIDK